MEVEDMLVTDKNDA